MPSLWVGRVLILFFPNRDNKRPEWTNQSQAEVDLLLAMATMRANPRIPSRCHQANAAGRWAEMRFGHVLARGRHLGIDYVGKLAPIGDHTACSSLRFRELVETGGSNGVAM